MGSKDASDVCAVSRSMRRQTDFAESMMNSATSSAADPVTISTFQQDADADTFFSAPASRWASCRSHNQKVQAARRVANGARRDRTPSVLILGGLVRAGWLRAPASLDG